MLVARQSLEERFTDSKPTEMERLCPRFFIKVCHKVVVAVQVNQLANNCLSLAKCTAAGRPLTY